jgi:hypothetical protein
MRSVKNRAGWQLRCIRQVRPPHDHTQDLIEIDLARRADNRLIFGSLESFCELLLQQLSFGLFFFSALAKNGLAPGLILCKQLSGVINVGGFGFPGWLAMPNHFPERNVNFELCSAARTFKLNLTASIFGGNHGRMLRCEVPDVKRGWPISPIGSRQPRALEGAVLL